MKKRTTITIDEALYNTANNNQDNFSRYVERLIERDLAESFREPIVKAVKQELMADSAFFTELASRLGTKTSIQAPQSPSKPDSAIPEHLLPNCCKTQDKCSHWSYDELNSRWTHKLTGEVKEAVE